MPRTSKVSIEEILDTAKRMLLDKDGEAFSMRNIAKECGISVGTIYNYYPDKDTLMEEIMIQDWNIALQKMSEVSENASDLVEGLSGIIEAMREFIMIYRHIWMKHGNVPGTFQLRDAYHNRLVREVSGSVRHLLERFGTERDISLDIIFTESILSSVTRNNITAADILHLAGYITKH
ncbi:MAG: TetR/AcrR family transcriptional regulator [Solobacterium sp.]|nr:TetR/AcrR family transcriptional regulator [Solobacterium sp.]